MKLHYFTCKKCEKKYTVHTGMLSKEDEALYSALFSSIKICPNCNSEVTHSESYPEFAKQRFNIDERE